MSNQFCGGHILLYHGIFSEIPPGLESRIHNVFPEDFKRQVIWLRQNFDIVTIDEFSKANTRKGLAVITFDDAYLTIFSEALPWLIKEGIPATVFLNSSLLEGEIFWRDKVRYLISNHLVENFLNFCGGTSWVSKVRGERFYKDTKNPNLNSKIVNAALDQFFLEHELATAVTAQLGQVIARRGDLISDPLITYGNHTHSHFVLSSLTEEEQRVEITGCQSWLEESGLDLSNIFAAPFGGNLDINVQTTQILEEQGARGIAMSRKAINQSAKDKVSNKVNVLERYMAPPTLPQLQDLAALLEQG